MDPMFSFFVLAAAVIQLPLILILKKVSPKTRVVGVTILLMIVLTGILFFSRQFQAVDNSETHPAEEEIDGGENPGGENDFNFVVFMALLVPIPASFYLASERAKSLASSNPQPGTWGFPLKASLLISVVIIAASPILVWLEFGSLLLTGALV